MGGNALKTVAPKRLLASEYHALAGRVQSALAQAWPAARPHVVRSVRFKADFGDLDVIVDAAGVPTDVRAELVNLFGSREVVHNGPVWSAEVDGFQLDLIVTPTQDYATAVDYFAWNDAGNLIGRIAHTIGFKYGHRGLHYLLRDGDHLVAELPVSRELPAILDFLGFMPGAAEAYQLGFDTLRDMFRFVASSRYFDQHAYALEARNHTARTRDRKRASYRAFLEWLDDSRALNGPDAGEHPAAHLRRAVRMFPGFARDLAAAQRRHALARARHAKFNGDLVRTWTGLDGKALGALMAACRNGLVGGSTAFDAFADGASVEDVRAYVEKMARNI